MINVSSLLNRPYINEFFDDYCPSYTQISQVAYANMGYIAPILALSTAYLYRDRIYSYATDLCQKYLPSFFTPIKVTDENETINRALDGAFQKALASSSKEGSYAKKGREDYQFPARFYGLTNAGRAIAQSSARLILRQKIAEKRSSEAEPLRVLDLGTGNGRFLLSATKEHQEDIQAHGISLNISRKLIY